jgi:hypothetical protein
VPGKLVSLAVPVQDIKDWRLGRFLQKFVSAMLLGGFERLAGIYFEKGLVNTGAGVGGNVVLGTKETSPSCQV